MSDVSGPARTLPGMKRLSPRILVSLIANLIMLPALAYAEAKQEATPVFPHQTEGVFVIKAYHFADGETLPEVKLHYVTLGQPRRDASGRITNAVLLLHGTTGRATELLTASFANPLYGSGGPLDASKFYIVLPDNIGHGESTKASDELRMRFPHFAYSDMVDLQHRLVTDGLYIDHLRLVGGISMGGMHTWIWGERWPDMMDALLPIACEPGPVSGRNLLWRRIYIRMIENDPEWKNGAYEKVPQSYQYALALFHMMDESPRHLAELTPTRNKVDAYINGTLGDNHAAVDPNDSIYAFDASRDYDPTADLGKIQARVMAINFADDQLNVAELGVLDGHIG